MNEWMNEWMKNFVELPNKSDRGEFHKDKTVLHVICLALQAAALHKSNGCMCPYLY